MTGIYLIKNLINNKVYVGQSVNIKDRWGSHKRKLNKNCHSNLHLQSSWNKYGEDNFEFKVLEECDLNNINEREIYYIKKYNSANYEKGYNKTFGGQDSTRAYTNEVKEKMSFNRLNNSKFRGENLTQSKLTENDVIEIKRMLVKEVSQSKIANIFNVTDQNISSIKRLETWSEVASELNDKIKELYSEYIGIGEDNPNSSLSNDLVLKIKKDLSEGIKLEDVSRKYNLNKSTVFNIKDLRNYKNIGKEYNEKISKFHKKQRKNLNRETVLRIRELISNGFKNKEISLMLDVGIDTVKRIKSNKIYKDVV